MLAVLTHENAPRLGTPDDPTLAVLQDPHVPHRGWFVGVVVAETLEAARAGAAAVRVTYETEPHDVTLTASHSGAYVPESANGGFPAVTEQGDPDGAFASSATRVDVEYRVPPLHNHPMEPHASTAHWDGDRLAVQCSSQGTTAVQKELARLFALPEDRITVRAEHVGGGFGSKGTPRPEVVLAAMAARDTGRQVTVALPRRYPPAAAGHRAPTLHRPRLGADHGGRLTRSCTKGRRTPRAWQEFVEQAAVPARAHVRRSRPAYGRPRGGAGAPPPSWMRAPGERPGMYALESAMDELAVELGIDPLELRIRNEPESEPDSGRPFSSRHLVECLREGARRFGWEDRDPGSVRARPVPCSSAVGSLPPPTRCWSRRASPRRAPGPTAVSWCGSTPPTSAPVARRSAQSHVRGGRVSRPTSGDVLDDRAPRRRGARRSWPARAPVNRSSVVIRSTTSSSGRSATARAPGRRPDRLRVAAPSAASASAYESASGAVSASGAGGRGRIEFGEVGVVEVDVPMSPSCSGQGRPADVRPRFRARRSRRAGGRARLPGGQVQADMAYSGERG
ncbi:hypothetical protein STENM327S_07355 [Streptomyces tendae]